MADKSFEKGREGFADGTLDWDGQTFSAALIDLDTSEVGIRLISSSTNATPIQITTSVTHGFSNGDIVSITGHTTNTAANGIWAITAASGNVFNLTDPITATNSVGNGTGGATGRVVNLGPSASGDNWDDFDAALVGTIVNLTSPTATSGVLDAADVAFPTVSGATVEAAMIFRNTGTTTTSRMVVMIDGHQIVTCAVTTASSATTLPVERLRGGIANGTVLAFSNGASATLSAAAFIGDRALTVSALAATISGGSRADAAIVGSGFPITPNGTTITLAFDSGPNRILSL